jgi:hypothetical protein
MLPGTTLIAHQLYPYIPYIERKDNGCVYIDYSVVTTTL